MHFSFSPSGGGKRKEVVAFFERKRLMLERERKRTPHLYMRRGRERKNQLTSFRGERKPWTADQEEGMIPKERREFPQ